MNHAEAVEVIREVIRRLEDFALYELGQRMERALAMFETELAHYSTDYAARHEQAITEIATIRASAEKLWCRK